MISYFSRHMSSVIRVNPIWIVASRYVIHIASVLYLGINYYWGLSGQLPGDPVQALLDFSGISALNLLIATLLISPIAQHFKFAQLMPLRKTLGVYAAVYALFHLYIFIAYELAYEWLLVAQEIVERPYITVGFVALTLLVMLLATSLQSIRKRMKSRWQKLHNSIYLIAILGSVHFLWSVKSNITEPVIYLVIFAILLMLPKIRRSRIFSMFKKAP